MFVKFAITDFLDDRKLKNVSGVTLERYRLTLKEFQDFLSQHSITHIEEVTPSLIRQYLLYCQQEKNNNPTTSNSKLRVLKSLFNHLVECDLITEKQNPVRKIPYAKEDIKIDVFKEHHIRKMLAYYRRLKDKSKSFYAMRAHTLILFLLSTGLRVGEVSNLTWDKVDLVNGQAIVFGKLRIETSIPLTNRIVKELIEWRAYLTKKFRGQELVYVFPTSLNTKWSENGIKNLFKRLKQEMGFKDVRLSAHTFRHYFCHQLIKNGADAFTVQRLMRHKDMDMTKRYIAMWGSDLSEQNDKFNPINKFDIDI